MDWDTLRREARTLENDIDAKLVAFSRLGTTTSTSYNNTPNNGESLTVTAAEEIQQMLQRLGVVNDALADVASRRQTVPQTYMHTLSRHSDILSDYRQEFSKTQANIRRAHDRDALLGNVRHQIDAHRSASARREDLYLQEHDKIQSSDRMADEAIALAMGTRDALREQRQTLRGISGRMASVFARIPGVNGLMQKINMRKRRDTMIMAGTVASCLAFILLYTMR